MASNEVQFGPSVGQKLLQFFLTYRLLFLALVSLVLFTLVGMSIYHLTQEVQYEDVVAALSDTSWRALCLALLFTGLSYIALIGYDLNALEFIRRKLPTMPVFVTAFIAYAVGNTVGFGPLSGGAVRYRAYSRLGLSPSEIGQVIAFVTAAFGIGLLSVSALAILAVAPHVSTIIGLDAVWLRAIAVVVLIVVFGMFLLSRNGRELKISRLRVHLPDSRTSSRQFLVTAFDIAAASSVLFVLLPDTNLGWPTFFAFYAVAIGAGVLSHVPAGLGVFEAVILAGLSNRISLDQLLGSLVLYRLIYYILPLVLAAILLLIIEAKQFSTRPAIAEAAHLASRLSPLLISCLALIAGLMLIFSSVVPTPGTDLEFIHQYLPLWLIEGAHFLSSLLGLALVVSARSLGQGIGSARWVALFSATAALVLAFVKAIAIYEALLLICLIALLVLNPNRFRRHASLSSQALESSWLAAIGFMILSAGFILFFVYRETEYAQNLWWQFELSQEAPRGLRALLGLSIAAGGVALFSLLRPARLVSHHPSPDDMSEAVQIVDLQNNADANLVRMGDKRIFFSTSGNAFIMFGIQGRSWIALGDPVGATDEFPELIWDFMSAARMGGARPGFYQVSADQLSLYADVGLRAFKLGELAIIDLKEFDLKGSRYANIRQSYNRAMRDGLTFSVVQPQDLPFIIDRLRHISDEWLSHHSAKEKSFSLGNFSDDYILSQPVCLAHYQGEIVAFATMMMTGTKVEATVDLMRFSRSAPKGAMDFLFASMLDYFKLQGFQQFNLGMAPLSGMMRREAAPIWDRIGSTIFEHGDRFYNFKGLKAFKSKFHPRWEPRYLAVTNTGGAALALMDVTFLIGGGVKGIISK